MTITADVVEALQKHKRLQNQNKLRLGPAYQDHGLIVCTGLGTPIHPSKLPRSTPLACYDHATTGRTPESSK